MKNHMMVNGRLLQMNKKFSHLKRAQQERITEWLYQAYASLAKADGYLTKEDKERVYAIVKQQIEEANTWIPFGEVIKRFQSKRNAFKKRFLKARGVVTPTPIPSTSTTISGP